MARYRCTVYWLVSLSPPLVLPSVASERLMSSVVAASLPSRSPMSRSSSAGDGREASREVADDEDGAAEADDDEESREAVSDVAVEASEYEEKAEDEEAE